MLGGDSHERREEGPWCSQGCVHPLPLQTVREPRTGLCS